MTTKKKKPKNEDQVAITTRANKKSDKARERYLFYCLRDGISPEGDGTSLLKGKDLVEKAIFELAKRCDPHYAEKIIGTYQGPMSPFDSVTVKAEGNGGGAATPEQSSREGATGPKKKKERPQISLDIDGAF